MRIRRWQHPPLASAPAGFSQQAWGSWAGGPPRTSAVPASCLSLRCWAKRAGSSCWDTPWLLSMRASKDSLKAETQNITKSFEDLDDQVNSETGYTLENSMGLEGTARGGEMYRAVPSRYHLSTQKMYELKTKLRCSCEGRQYM
uniref:Uncharacterized protein n=1 Tax=Canis lupus dingo TaxID=286419 RepID=A0A8C0QX34_CANLU